MISRDNNDRTANNTSTICDLVGLDYHDVVPWNVIPWWVKDPDLVVAGQRPTLTTEAKAASRYVRELMDLLPGIEKVLLLGKEAQAAWSRAMGQSRPSHVMLKQCPHTSPLAYNHEHNRVQTQAAFRWAAER